MNRGLPVLLQRDTTESLPTKEEDGKQQGDRPHEFVVSTSKAKQRSDEDDTELWRHRLPLFVKPDHVHGHPEPHRAAWLPQSKHAQEYLSLFWDLVAVAALNTFSSEQEINSSSSVATFIQFFILYWCSWVTQTVYDIRFQGEDVVHRLFKFFQVAAFVFMASSAGAWNLGLLMAPQTDDVSSDAFSRRGNQLHASGPVSLVQPANVSSSVVTTALSCSRFILCLQYVYVTVLARQTGRPFRTQVAQAACCLFSTICCIIATAIPFTTQTQCAVKIGFLYAGIGTEMLGTTVVSRHFDFARMPSERLAERMSTFTLIILGEGILGLLRAIDKVTLAFAGYDSWLYFNTFCIIAIMFQLFFFSFSGFSKHLWVGRTRSTIWTLLHFPFHLVLLLMMSALKNNVVGLAFDRAVRIGRKMVEQLSLTAAGLLPTELTGSQRWDVLFISQLNLQPDALQEREILLNATELNSKLPLDLVNPYIEVVKYAGKAMAAMAEQLSSRRFLSPIEQPQVFEIHMDPPTVQAYEELSALSAVNPANATEESKLEAAREAASVMSNFFGQLGNDAFAGATWQLPAAGSILLLTCILAFVRRERQTKLTLAHDGIRFIFGAALCLLALLDIGRQTFQYYIDIDPGTGSLQVRWDEPAPVYRLMASDYSLLIMAATYGFAIAADQAFVYTMYWRRHRAVK